MKTITLLLRKNMSPARIAGFVVSNFIGLAIIIAGIQFWLDARGLWQSDNGFMQSDLLVLNKRVTSSATWGDSEPVFDDTELADLKRQPWVRAAAPFTASDYRVWASVGTGGRSMSTMLFFESVPDAFVDGKGADWGFRPGDSEVPVIIPKDYLALYNFGFAGSAGLPRMSEGVIGSIPLRLTLSSDDRTRVRELNGRIAGYSNKLNTILVPESFMQWSNETLGSGKSVRPSRVAVDVRIPGDVAIKPYLEEHGLEVAGDKSNSQAAYLLRVVAGIVVGVGLFITALSLVILLLSMSLLLEKNRDKLHSLLMLGYPLSTVSRPYRQLVLYCCLGAWLLALVPAFAVRCYYMPVLTGLGGSGGACWIAPLIGFAIAAFLTVVNVASVNRKVRKSWW